MKSFLLFALLGLGLAFQSCAQRAVYVNGQALNQQTIQALEYQYQVRIQPGRYWYDPTNGWWGFEGGAVAGIMMPGLRLGGPLNAQASRGRTGVFINGRQINRTELSQLQQLVGAQIGAGRYWVDSYGNAGPQGGYATVNLYQAYQAAMNSYGGGNSAFSKSYNTGAGYGSNGSDFYIMGEDFSYSNF